MTLRTIHVFAADDPRARLRLSYKDGTYRATEILIDPTDGDLSINLIRITRTGADYRRRSGMWLTLTGSLDRFNDASGGPALAAYVRELAAAHKERELVAADPPATAPAATAPSDQGPFIAAGRTYTDAYIRDLRKGDAIRAYAHDNGQFYILRWSGTRSQVDVTVTDVRPGTRPDCVSIEAISDVTGRITLPNVYQDQIVWRVVA